MLKDAYYKKNKDTPEVTLDASKGVLHFKGVCMPENPIKFFNELTSWTTEYIKNPVKDTKLILELEYINSVSMKYFYDLAVSLIADNISPVVHWRHKSGDLMMIEKGVEFEYLTQMKVVIEEIE